MHRAMLTQVAALALLGAVSWECNGVRAVRMNIQEKQQKQKPQESAKKTQEEMQKAFVSYRTKYDQSGNLIKKESENENDKSLNEKHLSFETQSTADTSSSRQMEMPQLSGPLFPPNWCKQQGQSESFLGKVSHAEM